MPLGRVKWFSPSKGYGFITADDGGDIFLHFTGLAAGQERRLFPDDRVEYELADGEKGKKAVELRCIERAPRPENESE
ncbi:MAG: cold shock domain-containing protein [Planctomycetota bacterium]|jgi:CspA family cold shock protein|nr:cold shock domain-containing protein [Planctomycetota bacterium]